MASGIMIMGSPGAGKTTLGRLVAAQLGYSFVDIDDYIWRKDTPQPFSAMYTREEKISRLMDAISGCGNFVMAGSMNSFHEHFDPYFDLVVHLHARAQLRIRRAHTRELSLFGDRVLPGGDMYEAHQRFLYGVAGYDFGFGSSTLQQHETWLKSLSCDILRLDGSHALEENMRAIIGAYRNASSSRL